MAQTTVSVRMDAALKRDFDAICEDLGITMSAAVTILAKKMTREKRLPFELSADPFYSAANTAVLEESAKQLDQGKTVTKTLDELQAMADK